VNERPVVLPTQINSGHTNNEQNNVTAGTTPASTRGVGQGDADE